jgi:ribosomal protein S18 acetylase RimI-like enzyme
VPGVLALWAAGRSAAAVTPDTPESVAALLDRDPDALLIAVQDEEVVGAIVAGWDGWRANLYRLVVREDHRRRGIATALVEEAHARLRARGAPRATALVAHDELEATGFWEAAGYARDPQMLRYVRNL